MCTREGGVLLRDGEQLHLLQPGVIQNLSSFHPCFLDCGWQQEEVEWGGEKEAKIHLPALMNELPISTSAHLLPSGGAGRRKESWLGMKGGHSRVQTAQHLPAQEDLKQELKDGWGEVKVQLGSLLQ